VPLYEYECKKCHQLIERIQKFSDEPFTVCPNCGGELEKVLSAPAVQFKGSGWYVTDYPRKSGKSESSSSGSQTSESGSSSGTKSDGAKPESAKSETTSKKESSASKDKK
jgi:putative FmdB family regulatory protein